MNFLTEAMMVPVLVVFVCHGLTGAAECPDGYQSGDDGGCYSFHAEAETFNEARGHCLSTNSSDLVIIDDQGELDYLLGEIGDLGLGDDRLWIGHFDVSVEGNWKWVDCEESGDWQRDLWINGVPPANDAKDCATLIHTNGSVADEACVVTHPFICEISPKDFSRDDANVHDVRATPVSWTETNVTWEVSEVNCDVSGYDVYYTSRGSGNESVAVVEGGDVGGVVLDDLESGVIYDVSVAALQADRKLPKVGPITVCPYNYEESPSGSCYYFSTGTSTYQRARSSCLSDPDGDLLILNDQAELDYISERLSADDGQRWIGYFDRASEGQWTWSDCQQSTPWQESLWSPDQPTGYDEDCGALETDGLISDYVCDRYFKYICEISPKEFSRDDANVRQVTAERRTKDSVTISWEVSDANCDVYGYTIRVTDTATNAVKIYYAHGGNTNTYVADGLQMETTYQVTVAGLQIDRQLPEVGFISVTTGCPDGYETSPAGDCYIFAGDSGTFDVARGSCLSDPGGDLVVIDSQEELDYLLSESSSLLPNQTWWIGFFDISVEGSWRWSDCQPANEWHNSLWANGEPGNGLEDCGSLGNGDGTLSDNVCEALLPYICELTDKGFSRDDANVRNVAAIPISSTETNVTWEVSAVNCDVIGYKIYYTPLSTGIRHIETVYGGDVDGVTLSDLEEYVVYDVSVVALQTDRELPEVTISVCPYLYDTSPWGSCYYFSGGTTTYERARASCLSSPEEDLVIINNKEEFDYLVGMTSTDDTPSWIGYFDRATEGTWTWADCQNSDPWQESLWAEGQPTGYDEDCGVMDSNGEISDYVCDRYFRYICEVSPKGFSREDANAFGVTAVPRTQTSVTIRWEVSEFNCDVYGYTVRVINLATHFVKVYYAHGGEMDYVVADGLQEATSYRVTVAGLQIDRQLPQVGFVNVTTGCPSGYQTSPTGGCYYFFQGGRTFDWARRNCLSDPDSDLVIIDSNDELEYLMNATSAIGDDEHWWIGFFDISVEGSWTWSDCQPSSSWHDTLWADGEPGNMTEDCGSFSNNDGTLSSNVCDEFLPFVCEINIKGFSRDEANVQHVMATPVSERVMNVTWKVSTFNCDVIGYNVYYTPRTSGIRHVETVWGGDADGVTLEDLERYVIYDIGVAALQFDRELPEVGVSVCPYPYVTSPSGGCYYFSRGSTHYQSARSSCLSGPNSDLVIISDQEELDYLMEMTAQDDLPRWIGYYDRATEGKWTWADCQSSDPWQESLWAVGEPTGYDEDCGALDLNDQISDYVCDQYFGYICEISPKGFSRDDANAFGVSATRRTQSSVLVRWEVSDINCDVFGYTIRVADLESQEIKVYYAHGGETSNAVADGLQMATNYQVTVAGLQIDGQLPQVGFVNVTTGCPSGYQTSPIGGCYYFSEDGRTFDYARSSCLSDPDSDLVIIDSQEELEYLKTASALGDSAQWWIGFFDISVEGTWTWTDCQPASSWHDTLWADGEPGNGTDDCGSFSNNDGTVSGNVCDEFLPFICEINIKGFSRDEANVQHVTATPVSERVINVTWEVSVFNCDVIGYNVYHTPRTSGIRHVETVWGGDAEGVTLEDLERYVIYDISVAALQFDRELPEVVVSVCPYPYVTSPSGGCYYFSRGSTHYQSARSSCLSGPNSDLVIISDQEELDYLVEMTAQDDLPRWIGYFDRATEGHWTWADCQNSDPWQESLWAVSEPTGYDEDCGALDLNDHISDYVCDQYFGYICEISPKGFSRDDANAFDVSAERRTPSSVLVRWEVSDTNCDVFGYTIRVTDLESQEIKVYYAHGGETNNVVADGLRIATTYQVTVAGLQIDGQLPQVGFVNVTTGCPSGYQTSPAGGCYYFFEEVRTFDVARKNCLSDPDSDLVIIDSQAELEYLKNATSAMSSTWWIGYFDISVEGSWAWADCQPANDWHGSLWADGEPDNGFEDCGSFNNTDGTLSDSVCDVFLPSICEITAKDFSRDDANVQNVMATPISQTETNVTWDVSMYNCDVIGYNVYYTPRTSGLRHVETLWGGDVDGVTLTDLEEYVIYDVSVAALQTDRELPEVGVQVCPYSYDTSPAGGCYYFSRGTTTYERARYNCLYDPDTDLAIIDDQEELEYLMEMTSDDDVPRWIGYFDRATEGQWTWADCQTSTPWQVALWSPGEPTGYDEDCGALDLTDQLSDYVCDQNFRYICEISPKGFSRDDANAFDVEAAPRTQNSIAVTWSVSEVNCDVYGYTIRVIDSKSQTVKVYYAHGGETSTIVADGLQAATTYQVTVAGLQIDRQLPQVGYVNVTTGCTGGYVASPTGGCYFFRQDGRTFDSARRSCLSDPESDLVIIDTQEELDYLMDAASALLPNANWWIGFFDIAVEGSWTWADCQPANAWHTSLWATGEPGNGIEDCGSVSSSDGTLSDNVCDVLLPYICEVTVKGFSRDEANAQNVAAVPVSVTETNVTWDVSPVNCDILGYNVYYTPRTSGLRSVVTVSEGDANGVTLQDLEEYVIYDISVTALQPDRELPEVGPITVCPYSYDTGPDGRCYYFSRGTTSYERARNWCLYDPDGDLVVINDQEELDYLVEMTSNDDTPRWIGYFDRAAEGTWTWADCQNSDTWQESLWAADEPTGYDEDCGALDLGDQLSDYVCDQNFRYICEISPKGFSRDDANAYDVTVVARTPTSLTVNWEVSDVNCDVYGYTIRVTDVSTNSVNVYYAHGGETTSTVADGLHTATPYQVTVAGLQIDRQLPQVGFVNASTGCPSEYITSPSGRCYHFNQNEKTFDSARRNCLSDPDSDLVIIDSQEELTYLIDAAPTLVLGGNWWIGFFDISVEGSWTWANCRAASEWDDSLWANGEPGNGLEDCGSLSSDNGTIASERCDVFLPFICEITAKGFSRDDANVRDVSAVAISERAINVTWEVSAVNCDIFGYNVYHTSQSDEVSYTATVYGGDVDGVTLENLKIGEIYVISVAALQLDRELPPVGPMTVCPEGYEMSPAGKCYYFSVGTTTYQGARRSCLSYPDDDLVIIDDQEELDYLLQRTLGENGTWWIGYFDRATEGVWTWADCEPSNQWQEQQWGVGEPTGYDEDCGALDDDGSLSDYVCDQYFRYICEISPKDFSRDDANAYDVTASPRSPTSVTVNWKVSDVNCDVYGYTVRVTDLTTQSVEIYYAHGGEINTIPAQGLEEGTTYQVTVAGLQIERELPQVGYVNVTTGCPNGYEAFSGSCYYFNANSRQFDSARRSCLSVPDGDLVIIDSPGELNFLMNASATLMPNQMWWIGFFDISVEGSWTWADCQAANEWHQSLWASGEPDNGVEDCGSLDNGDGRLSDNVCDMFLPSICEITEKGFSRDDANVGNVVAVPISEIEANVTWDVSAVSCDVFGYNVYYTSRATDVRSRKTVFGGDVSGATIVNLEIGAVYDVTVAALQTDRELSEVGPVSFCPYYYEESPAGSCYYFSSGESTYEWARYSCLSDPDGDLVIINDQEELDYLLGRVSGENGTRWIGYFDRATEGQWTWADCQSSNPWQDSLWAVGEPTGYDEDCGALGDPGELSDHVCDQSFRYICEISPKGFSRDDANAKNVAAVSISTSEVNVTWTTSEFNCDVYGYTLRMTDVRTDEVSFHYAHGGDTDSYVIDGLTQGSSYQVTVSGLQIDRELPEVGFVNVTTECPGFLEASSIGGCYYFSADPYNFDRWRGDCQSVPGGDMVIIDDQQELDYLLSTAAQLSISDFWLGFFDFGVEGDWRWATCEAPTTWQEALWATGEPGNAQEDCSVMNSAGRIESVLCDRPYPVVCEYTPKEFSLDDTNVNNVTASATGSSSILVGWEVSPVGCEVFGFRIFYYPDSDPTAEESVSVYGGDVASYELQDLMSDTAYTIHVAALHQSAELSRVGPAGATTLPGCEPQYLTETSGRVQSPDYPEPYPPNQDCSWFIKLPSENDDVLLTFDVFALENGVDYLYVGEGDTVGENVLVELTGEAIPEDIRASTHQVWLRFTSNDAVENSGFSATYSSVEAPTTPPLETRQQESVIIRVLNKDTSWFDDDNRLKLASAVAQALNEYCNDNSGICVEDPSRVKGGRRGLLAVEYQAEDVDFVLVEESGSDLEVYTWVWESVAPGEGVDQDVLKAALDENEDTVTEVMDDPTFQYQTDLPETEPTDPDGLEAWAIVLIAVAAVAVLILIVILIVGYIEWKARQKRYEYTSKLVDEVDSSPAKENEYQGSLTNVHVEGEEPSAEPEGITTADAAGEASPKSGPDDSEPPGTVENGGTDINDATKESPPSPADVEQVSMEDRTSDEDGGEENKGFENEEEEVTKF